jgi:cell division protein FtsQ
MDARIRARRARIRAEAVGRRQRRTLSLFVLLLVSTAVAVALRSPLFAVSAIEVRGVGAERGQVVRQAAGIREGQHLLTAPLAEAQSRVERLAWVKSADVRRVPPATVAVDVTPRQPMLTVETRDASWKIDEDAVVVNGGRVADAPVISAPRIDEPRLGTPIREQTVRDAVQVHRGLPAWLREQVVGYRIPQPRDLWLRLAVPAKGADAEPAVVGVRFGTAKDLDLKAEVIRVLLPQAVDVKGDLDVRAPANPIVVESGRTAAGSG